MSSAWKRVPQSALVAVAVASAAAFVPGAAADGLGRWIGEVRTAWERDLHRFRRATTIPWVAGDGRRVELVEWRGAAVSLLTVRGDHDPAAMKRLVDALDAFWKRCREICGNTPPPDAEKAPLVGGRAIVAEFVGATPETTAAAISIPGLARISLGPAALESLVALHRAAGSAATPSVPLGERLPAAIARTFVYFESELDSSGAERFGPLSHALAELLAAEAADSLGWLTPADPRPLERVLAAYRERPDATFASTLARGRGVGQPVGGPTGESAGPGWNDAEALWMAILLECRHRSGERDFVRRVWTTLTECPPAEDETTATGNLVVALSAASRADLTGWFRSLRFDIDRPTAERVAEAVAPRKIDVRSLQQPSGTVTPPKGQPKGRSNGTFAPPRGDQPHAPRS